MATTDLTVNDFQQTIARDGVVVIDWWAAWCAPCQAFAPIYEQVASRYPDVVFAKVDTEAEPELAEAFEIQAIPTLMLFRDGILLFRRPGLLPAEALEELIRQAQALDMDEIRRQILEELDLQDEPSRT